MYKSNDSAASSRHTKPVRIYFGVTPWGQSLAMEISGFFDRGLLLDIHILEFARVENLAALLALDEFTVFFAGDDLNAWVFAMLHGLLLWLA